MIEDSEVMEIEETSEELKIAAEETTEEIVIDISIAKYDSVSNAKAIYEPAETEKKKNSSENSVQKNEDSASLITNESSSKEPDTYGYMQESEKKEGTENTNANSEVISQNTDLSEENKGVKQACPTGVYPDRECNEIIDQYPSAISYFAGDADMSACNVAGKDYVDTHDDVNNFWCSQVMQNDGNIWGSVLSTGW